MALQCCCRQSHWRRTYFVRNWSDHVFVWMWIWLLEILPSAFVVVWNGSLTARCGMQWTAITTETKSAKLQSWKRDISKLVWPVQKHGVAMLGSRWPCKSNESLSVEFQDETMQSKVFQVWNEYICTARFTRIVSSSRDPQWYPRNSNWFVSKPRTIQTKDKNISCPHIAK